MNMLFSQSLFVFPPSCHAQRYLYDDTIYTLPSIGYERPNLASTGKLPGVGSCLCMRDILVSRRQRHVSHCAYVRGSIPSEVRDRMALNFVWDHADRFPVTRNGHVIQISPLHLIGADKRPPNRLRCPGNSERASLRNNWRPRRRAICHGRHQVQKIFQRQRPWSRKGKRARQLRPTHQISQNLRDVHDLQITPQPSDLKLKPL